MFDLVTGKATHIPSQPAAPIVVSTLLQAAIVSAVLLPALFLTGALPEPQMMMAFVAAPPPPPPPPPAPAPPKTTETKPPSSTRPVMVTQEPAAPLEPPSDIGAEALQADDEGVPGGVEGGVPGGVPGGVVGGLPEVPPPPPPVRRDPVRVGGQIQEPKLLKRVEPIYPPVAVSAHVQGVVILEAIVDREGVVEEVRVLRSANSLLDRAAIDAVRQWQYSPVILNGRPERFILTVVLSFNLTTS
jgi:protein TonB